MIDEKKLIEDIEKEFDGVCVYDVSPSQAVNDFVEIVDRQPKVGWIPCSEMLPEDTKTKAITFADGSVDAGYYSEEKWWCVGDSVGLEVVKTENVIAWMPLPEPYKEQNNG